MISVYIFAYKCGSLCYFPRFLLKTRLLPYVRVFCQSNKNRSRQKWQESGVIAHCRAAGTYGYSHLSNNREGGNKRVGVQKLQNQLDFFHQFLSQNKVLQLKMTMRKILISFCKNIESFVMKSIRVQGGFLFCADVLCGRPLSQESRYNSEMSSFL